MINTWSKFIYGGNITTSNNLGDFSEGGGDLVATLDAMSYTIGELLEALEDALNLAGANTYTCSVNRTTGLVTIAADDTFDLLLNSGDNNAQSFWSILGFDTSADLTGDDSYTGTMRAGTTYYPQFLLQSYIGPDDNKAAIDPMVNRTPTGRTEVIRFGVDRFIEFDIKFITDRLMDGVVIKNNPSGHAQAQAFLTDIIAKTRFEFVPDMATPATFYKVVCESTVGFKDGTGFKLKELFMQNLPDVYETGVITLRVVS
jgi:hypothetical protein